LLVKETMDPWQPVRFQVIIETGMNNDGALAERVRRRVKCARSTYKDPDCDYTSLNIAINFSRQKCAGAPTEALIKYLTKS
jgi:hypothetical protein